MASYLRPRRGKKATAESQAIVLKKGEVFFEIDANGISTGSSAKACGKIKMGDGSTTYSNLGYFIDVDTSVIAFTDTATATAAAQGDDYYSQLNAIAPTATVKSIFGNVKSLLYKMATNLTELNNDIVFPFGIDPDTGDYGYYKAGADTVTPFKSGGSTVYVGQVITSIGIWATAYIGQDLVSAPFHPSYGWIYGWNVSLTALQDFDFDIYGASYSSHVQVTFSSEGTSCTFPYNASHYAPMEKLNSTPMHVSQGSTINSSVATSGSASEYQVGAVFAIVTV